jgi:hypothetical protein
MSLLLERYELNREIEQLSEVLKAKTEKRRELDEKILADADVAEVLNIGNGGYYRVGINTTKVYPPDDIIALVLDLPSEALTEVVKISDAALKRLVKQKFLSKRDAEAMNERAIVTTTKTLGQLKRFEDDVLEALSDATD